MFAAGVLIASGIRGWRVDENRVKDVYVSPAPRVDVHTNSVVAETEQNKAP